MYKIFNHRISLLSACLPNLKIELVIVFRSQGGVLRGRSQTTLTRRGISGYLLRFLMAGLMFNL
jgi:hypothetical protein